MRIRVSRIVYRVSSLVLIIIMAALLTNIAYARPTVESLPQVEKLFMEEKYESVVSASTKLIDSGSHGREELFYLKGLSQLKLAKYAPARETFERMVERYPKGKRAFDGYIGIGDALFLEGKHAASISKYNEALSNYPDYKNSSIAYYKIGEAYRKLGNSEKAGEYFKKVRDSSPLSFESKMIPKDIDIDRVEKASILEPKIEPQAKCEETEYVNVISAGEYYYVQAGFFKSKNNAVKLTEKLKQAGYDSYLSIQTRAGIAFYRVKVGRFKTKTEAEVLSKRLKAAGYKTRVCP